MSFSNFKLQVILRLLLLATSFYGLIYYTFIEVNYIRVFFLGLFALIVLLALFYYINRTNKDTENFIQAILNNDFSIKYSEETKGKTFNKLYQSFNLLNTRFKERAINEASEYRYIVTLIEQMQVGVIIYDEQERVQLVNDAFKKFIDKQELINLQIIKKLDSRLFNAITSIKSGESTLFEGEIQGQKQQLSMAASEIKLRDKYFKIVSFQDIHSTLDHNENMAWQKLIRVLTHEIMNSVSPITSLSSSLKMLAKANNDGLSASEMSTMVEGLDAIENRSQGLLNFTNTYRKLARVPLPKLQQIDGRDFFKRVEALFTPSLTDTQIEWQLDLPNEAFELNIDPPLIEQVLINLLKNAREAVDPRTGKINLTISVDPKMRRTSISVTDNGSGIPEEIQDKIFIPFYTTKVEGSGIGLSLSRQIVSLHKGMLTYQTSTKGTSFLVRL
ncbi:sensor histidine kinase [Roseivirga pacifica]|uniref:sensor histidine kinase n=1 Tax=Roseivirga pacifica TaxID=1267423 RepID=UPI00227C47E3|nr:ATP-binding protein [Roseivirga pacifica]